MTLLRSIIICVAALFTIVACSSQPPVQEQDFSEKPKEMKEQKQEVWQWGYSGENGPNQWAQLNPQYDMCQSGQLQSPINLVWRKPISPNPLKVLYKEGDAIVTNAGYTIRMELTPQSQITFNGQDYLLEKIEIRTPSEHQLSGNTLPLELQFYHRSPNGLKQAIISLFAMAGEHSQWFDEVWDKAVKTPLYKSSATFRFNPEKLIPPRQTFYHYEGSLTHPPCLEGVQWMVFNTPLQLSRQQINAMRAIYNNNNRPVQPSGDRKVTNY